MWRITEQGNTTSNSRKRRMPKEWGTRKTLERPESNLGCDEDSNE